MTESEFVSQFELSRERLLRMIRLRIDARLAGRVDPADIVQEGCVEGLQRCSEFDPTKMPFYLWIRMITLNKLTDLYRYHLGAQKRTAHREISLQRGFPQVTSVSIAAQLIGKLTTASEAAVRAEMKVRLQQVLNAMDELDREVLSLRHFENMTNGEVAKVLEISKNAASNRYIRALHRLKQDLSAIPGFTDPFA